MTNNYNQIQPQNLPFLFDSLYCKDEILETEETINPMSIYEEEELLNSLLSKEEQENHQMYNVHVVINKNIQSRKEAIDWILEAIDYHSFSVQTAILAVNYFDRFLIQSSQSDDEKMKKPWMNHLVAVACLSLAAKVEETQVPLLLDLQVESRYFFEPRTIKRMELLILSTLKWKMNPITPFSFLDFFIKRLGLLNKYIFNEFIRRCEGVLLSTITDCRFMCYLPSVMAAAIMLQVIDWLKPYIGFEYQEQLLGILGIVKDNVTDCHRLVQEVASNIDFNSNKRKFVGALPGSPNGVMDVSFSSDSSDDSSAMASPISSSPEPLSKKTRTL